MSVPSFQDTLDNLQAKLAETNTAMDVFSNIVFGSMVLLLQAGFAFLEAGSVRSKNTSNILIKNLLDSFVAGLAYWVIGYALAYGDGNGFIGWTKWTSSEMDDIELASWFFQFVFAATAATIVSGAIAERVEFVAYLIYSFCITGIIYPVVTHWVWTSDGWLTRGSVYDIDGVETRIGYEDFAGSGVVHALGGVAAFCGAVIIGPRIGRFHPETGIAVPLRGHSVPFAALGGFILIFGFMAFNGGSQLAVSSLDDAKVVSLSITNTVISGSTAAFVSLIIHKVAGARQWSLLQTLNGALTGMVAVCAGCNILRPWASFCMGIGAGFVHKGISTLMIKLKIDDPLDAVAVHFGGGCWGVIALAFFKWDEGILMSWNKKSGILLGWQLVGLISIIAWTGILSTIMFLCLKLAGIFRVSPELEKKGLDIQKHGEPSYPLESYGHGYLEEILTILENGQLSRVPHGFQNGTPSSSQGHFESPEVEGMRRKNNSDIDLVKTELKAREESNGKTPKVSSLAKTDSPPKSPGNSRNAVTPM